jgi:uncharacterized Zn finger protein
MSTELYLECDECGAELEVDRTTLQNNMRDVIFYVKPCQKCMRAFCNEQKNKKNEPVPESTK